MKCPFLAMCVTILQTMTIFSKCANVHPSTEKYSFYVILSIMVPSTIPVVEDKSLKTQYQVSHVQMEAMEVDPAAGKGNPRALPTMSPALARSCPRSRPCSQSVCQVARLTAHLALSRAHSCACPCQPGGRHGPSGTHAG